MNSQKSNQPHWQLPEGVTRGTMDYVESTAIADDYDEYFAFSELFQFDEDVVHSYIPAQGLVADFGCGTGRALIPLVQRGNSGLAVDLSEEMLRVVQDKAELDQLDIQCQLANLVDLSELATNSIDHAICLFSTLGMIHGAENRQLFLQHVQRVTKPSGRFVLHIHNFWSNLFDPSGTSWVIGHLWRSKVLGKMERGDKYYPYRGIPNFFLHLFSRKEILTTLKQAELNVIKVIPLSTSRQHELPCKWWFPSIRAGGWIIICEA
ncbi:MAG: class I SAM-dependent methyltransferase [Pirellulales bacterium]|jgi:ubiquinone/menaquinone biosynthesis C-methylase UbiE